eukprot:TRINITY_DN11568_c0_g1_i1.p1 TRINITY_DN11568_c0_g1~~TRINITY_DN11568_c0_g1_i1.p1  ORF type:complete len:458 (+),score=64.43 TRINITY_DN11568_c0_g1_i1:3-1376(+)
MNHIASSTHKQTPKFQSILGMMPRFNTLYNNPSSIWKFSSGDLKCGLPLTRPAYKPANPALNSGYTYKTTSPPLDSYKITEPPLDRIPPQLICRYFNNGYCRLGDKCKYAHVDPHTGRVVKYPKYSSALYHESELKDCIGQIYNMARDQHGCRFVQSKLNRENIDLVFNEIIGRITQLMNDPFGNYLCQKVIEMCSEDQKTRIFRECAGTLVTLSKSMHGTRPVQSLLDRLSTKEEAKIARDAFRGSIVGLIQNIHGNHVVQKCISRMEPNENQFLYDAVVCNFRVISSHKHGCCVIQRCIDNGTIEQNIAIVEEVVNNAEEIVLDQFGNYVVQYILDKGIQTEEVLNNIIAKLLPNLFNFARHKSSSNVIEKCITLGNSDCVSSVIAKLLEGEQKEVQDRLLSLLLDSYGNYVVQTCLAEGKNKSPELYQELTQSILPTLSMLRSSPYFNRLQSLL